MTDVARCSLCGEPMPAGEEMFKYHGYSGDCPKPPLERRVSFSRALELVKSGKRVARSGWNGKGMFIFLVPGSVFMVNRPPLLGIYPEGTTVSYHAHVDMKTADGQVVPWLCSQTDLLAEDWVEVTAPAEQPGQEAGG